MAADGFELLLAGHTHGGQVCVPGVGALVTNCGLDRRDGQGAAPLARLATPGCTSPPASAPTRPPRSASPARREATILTLIPR